MFNPIEFLSQTKLELRKVTWPTREETLRLTRVVILVSLAISIYLGLLDFVFSEGVKVLIK